jgi:hypothetical protein
LAVKYALIGAMVLIGLFAFAKRDFVLDAFHWDPHNEGLPIPAFDPVARAQQLATAPPGNDALRVAQAPDVRGAALAGVQNDAAAPPVAVTGGTAALSGTVVGPSGAVANATVHVERLVGDQVGTVDLTTDASGSFGLANAQGGRYRVRAWQAPVLAQLGSEVAFVTDGEAHSFNLELTAPSGRDVDVDVSSGGWVLGGSPSISVVVSEPYVTGSGQVDLRGSAGLATNLSVGGALAGGGSGATDGRGGASFGLRCAAVGSATASLTVGSYVQNLDLPACAAPATAAPAPPPAPTTAPAPPGQPAPAPVPAGSAG